MTQQVIAIFRECKNPACGLRYPVDSGSPFEERCPLCLGRSKAMLKRMPAEPEPRIVESNQRRDLRALLDNVRSGWNVGSILRSAEGLGLAHVYLGGITPRPDDERVQKTALGAENMVSWSVHRNGLTLLRELKSQGHPVWALEKTQVSEVLDVAVSDEGVPERLVIVVGNERIGVDPDILRAVDRVVHLEMLGQKTSFNVAVAFAVAAHVISRAVQVAGAN